MTVKFERIPYMVVFDEVSAFKDTYGGAIGKVAVEAMQLKPEVPSDRVVIFSHPIGGGSWLPLVTMLAKMGVHTIYANTRYRGNDTALIMERAVMDFGAVIRHAKERLGYSKVYLGGWSGGGAQSLFYQAEAQDPRVTHTPAGDPYDLTAAGFIPADGVLLLAAHLGNGAAGSWRARANIMAMACSAVVIELPNGVFITTMPLAVAAGMSTLSTPMPARAMTCSLFAAAITSLSSLAPERMAMPS